MTSTAQVYGFWDKYGQPLYVGMSGGLLYRVQAHRAKPWWPEVASIMASEEMPWDEAEATEYAEILRLQPLYNVAGKNGLRPWEMAQAGYRRYLASR